MPRGFSLVRLAYSLRLRVRSLLRRNQVDEELHEEIAYYLDRLTEQHIAAGMSEQQARQAAKRTFGGAAQRIEECRDVRGVSLLEDFARDTRYGARTLLRAPAFSMAVILTLSLGIGATVAVFTVVNHVLLRPLPYPDPERLFQVSHAQLGPFMPQPSLSDNDYLTYRAHDNGFQSLTAYSTYPASLLTLTAPARLIVGRVTTDFFKTLGVDAALGRTFLAADESHSDDLIVLGHDIWRTRLGGDASIVGKSVTMDGRQRNVLGVMPAGFAFPKAAQAWTLYTVRLTAGNSWNTPVLGRLEDEITPHAAEAQFQAIATRFKLKADASWTSGLIPLKDVIVGDVRRPLEVFCGAVIVVLLIACANVANLLLARGSVRQRELAVRAAIGAGRGRLIRQLLAENLLLAFLGGTGGVLLAVWSVPSLLALAPAGQIPRIETIRVDATVTCFALSISLLTGLLFGLAPAFRLGRAQAAESLAPSMRRPGSQPERLRSGLVVAEVALSLVLLTAGGLLAQSFMRISRVETGFRAEKALSLTIDLPTSSYSSADQMHQFQEDLLGRIKSIPGVTAAGAVNWRPLGTMLIRGDFVSDSVKLPGDVEVDKPAISPGYFNAMGIRVREGRDFTAGDKGRRQPVAIVSDSVARMLDPNGRAVGQRISVSSRPGPDDWMVIVGIVDDVRQEGPSQPAHAAIYRPYLQVAQPFFLDHMSFIVRTIGDPLAVAPQIRAVVHGRDRAMPADTMTTMDKVLENSTAAWRFNARLLGSFALVALILSVVGIYGVLTYSVAQRTHEIGIRMALGAKRGAVGWLVLRRTLMLCGLGIVIGMVGALAATRVLRNLLFEITPTDVPTFVGVAATILMAGIAASYIPARRATRVDPLLALRHE